MEEKLKSKLDEITAYFQEDLTAIDKELAKSEEYSRIIDEEINKLRETTNGFGATKGGQRYLIEHLTNAVSLQSQRQSLRKDRFSIKKTVLDYSNKLDKQDASDDDLTKAIFTLIEKEKKTSESKKEISNEEDLDNLIDKILDE